VFRVGDRSVRRTQRLGEWMRKEGEKSWDGINMLVDRRRRNAVVDVDGIVMDTPNAASYANAPSTWLQ
jgi:hypothetical protein